MDKLEKLLQKKSIELIIWDFDGVIFDMDWNFQGSVIDFLQKIHDEIVRIDNSIIKDKKEFIARMFPYPEIDEVGFRYGKEAQDQVKSVFEEKETLALHRTSPHAEVINFIKKSKLPQSIWSNNLSSSIEFLLKEFKIDHKIEHVSSLDKVTRSKPDVEGFEMIKSAYPEISNNKIILVGDSLRSDKIASENAGIEFFHFQKD